MKLTLMMKDKRTKEFEEVTFTQTFVPYMYKRKVMALISKAEKKEIEELELMDLQNQLIVDIFQKQFTVTDIENGLNVQTSDEQIYNIFYHGILGWDEYSVRMKQVEEMQNDFLAEALKSVE